MNAMARWVVAAAVVAMFVANGGCAGNGSNNGEPEGDKEATEPDEDVKTAKDAPPCTPQCQFKQCGDDGCGSQCGACDDGGNWCVDAVCQNFTCTLVFSDKACNGGMGQCLNGKCCTPDCFDKECGDNGCGTPCGQCPDGKPCNNGKCGGCQPQCNGKQCGDDGCGSTCGQCNGGFTCKAGQCVKNQTTDSKVGQPCDANNDCTPPANAECFDYMPDGMCVIPGCDTEDDCPDGSMCIELSTADGATYTYCVVTCNTDGDCRPGYFCYPDVGVCWYEEGNGPCSQQYLNGWCEEGLYCIDGKCQEWSFECADNTFEPNNSKSAATVAQAGDFKVATESGLQICTGDSDWYKLTIPKGSAGTLGIWFYHEVGDLDLCLYDEAGTFITCRYPYEDYSVLWRDFDWNDEFLSALALSGPKTFYFKADGFTGATNNYDLYAWFTEWKDGFICTDFYSANECKGCNENGSCLKDNFNANLVQFPQPDEDEPYVGDGYIIEHSSSYAWARREVVMAIRYAIHEVQAKFPGTQPLGLMDMCQINGITPGFDVGNPRHPATTHDEGANIDVAYYQTGGDNTGKIVCDAQGGSNDGYYCTSVANHIVDLPRTAYFMAKLAANPRFRVAGMDQLIAPLVLDELEALKKSGDITASEYYTASSGIAYGDGWPFHHHHIHLSFDWWYGRGARDDGPIGCGFRFPSDPTWQSYLD